jgi:uncharacterized phiE125 gp8 family phage protein
MTADWTLVTAPTDVPLTLVEAKAQCRITLTDEDTLLTSYVGAARQAAEQYLGRGLLTQTWALQLSDWADRIPLPMAGPLQSVTSVAYYNDAGTLTTLAPSTYLVDLRAEPGRVMRAPNQVWPTLQSDRLIGVVITYVVGWASAAVLPDLIKQGLRLHVTYSDARASADAASILAAAQACWSLYGRLWYLPPCAA